MFRRSGNGSAHRSQASHRFVFPFFFLVPSFPSRLENMEESPSCDKAVACETGRGRSITPRRRLTLPIHAGEGRGAVHAPSIHHVPSCEVRFGSDDSSDDLSRHTVLEVVWWFV